MAYSFLKLKPHSPDGRDEMHIISNVRALA